MNRQALPTDQQLNSLTEAFRHDPVSNFVPLGNCYLALGRPQEAVQVGTKGLQMAPADIAGRMMVGTAMAQLHRWKEAQAELLKVVKADRNHGAGFRLLGEVLMRRNDFERALPVLQHAQNLNPSDSQILALVQRARAGQSLDPPPPVPRALAPRGSAPTAPPPPPAPRVAAPPALGQHLPQVASEFDEAPTRAVVGPSPYQPATPSPALGRVELQQKKVVRKVEQATAQDLVSGTAAQDARGGQAMSFAPVEHYRSPPPENPLAPVRPGPSSAPPPIAAPRPAVPDPGGPGLGVAVRPRLMPVEKPKDAAQEGLRVSAAVGEQYLNQLLVGGLLDVPNVRVSEARYDVSPGKRWGRSSARMFIYLFVILGAAGAGSGVWGWYATKQVASNVASHLDTARNLIEDGDSAQLNTAIEEVREAMKRDPGSLYSISVFAEVSAISYLLHGTVSDEEVQLAIDSVAGDVKDRSAKGYRELLIARSALTIGQLSSLQESALSSLASTTAELKDWLQSSPDDLFVQWLLGRAHLAGGAEALAKENFTRAHAGGTGPVIAAVELGNLHLDAGDYTAAMTLYDAVLQRSDTHELAFVGRSLARSERHVEAGAAMADINIGLVQAKGTSLSAWKSLALATAHHAQEDYEAFDAALANATNANTPQEPRFLARVGLARIEQGRVVDAAKARSNIRWYAANPEVGNLVLQLDVELLLARGLPEAALSSAGEMPSLRAMMSRGKALIDLGQPKKALVAFEEALELSPDDLMIQIWLEAARLRSSKGKTQKAADAALDSLGRKAKTKTARFIHGAALAAVGKRAVAKDKLTQSVEDLSGPYPNPLAYRSYLELASIELAAGKTTAALAYLDKSVEQNPGYLPTRDVLGQALVASDPERAVTNLLEVYDAKVPSVGTELAYARALMKTGGSKEDAIAAIRRAKDRNASVAGLQQAISAVDSGLFEELGVPAP